jgi:hypothetical protein
MSGKTGLIAFKHRLMSKSNKTRQLNYFSVQESTVEKVLRSIINDTALEGVRINELAKSKAQSIIANAMR